MWMQRPAPVPGCPNGLEYLLSIDFLGVTQIASLLESI